MKNLFAVYLFCSFFQFAHAQSVADIHVKHAGVDLATNTSVVDLGGVEVKAVGPTEIFSIENRGDAPLNLTGGARKIWKTGDGFNAFIVDESTLPYELAPGASATFSIKFAPAFYELGEKTVTISIYNNDADENPFVFVVKAKGTSSDIHVKHEDAYLVSYSTAIDFGAVRIGQSSPVKYFTIENRGEAPLTFNGGVFLGGENAASFVLGQEGVPSEILPGSSGTFSVQFKPATFGGDKIAYISIRSDDPDTEFFVFDLTGHATAPDISLLHEGSDVSFKTIDFGTAFIGETSAAKTFTIENRGDATLTLTGTPKIHVYGDVASYVIDDTNLPSSLEPGQSGTFTVAFKPQSAADYQNYISVASDSPGESSVSFIARGKGVVRPIPEIEVVHGVDRYVWNNTGTSLLQPVVMTKTGSAERIAIKNTGTADLVLTSPDLIIISGANASEFVVDKSALPAVIAPGASGYLYITFKPITHGNRYMNISIPNNDADENPFSFGISGFGTDPEIEISQAGNLASGGTVTFYTVPPGESTYPYDFYVRSSGVGDLQFYNTPMIKKVSGDTAEFIIDESTLSRVIPSSNVSKFSITFKPRTTGRKSMVVMIHNSDRSEEFFTFTLEARAGNRKGSGRTKNSIGEEQSDLEEVTFVTAFPNPSRGSFRIYTGGEANEKIDARVYNVMGKDVNHYIWSGGTEESIGETWDPGFYFLEVKTNKGREVLKLIKK